MKPSTTSKICLLIRHVVMEALNKNIDMESAYQKLDYKKMDEIAEKMNKSIEKHAIEIQDIFEK